MGYSFFLPIILFFYSWKSYLSFFSLYQLFFSLFSLECNTKFNQNWSSSITNNIHTHYSDNVIHGLQPAWMKVCMWTCMWLWELTYMVRLSSLMLRSQSHGVMVSAVYCVIRWSIKQAYHMHHTASLLLTFFLPAPSSSPSSCLLVWLPSHSHTPHP